MIQQTAISWNLNGEVAKKSSSEPTNQDLGQKCDNQLN